MWVIHIGKTSLIIDNKSNQWSSICYRTRVTSILVTIVISNICVGLTIKCVGFEPIHYAINLNVVSSSIVFSGFDYVFLSTYCYFESIKLFFLSNFFKISYVGSIF